MEHSPKEKLSSVVRKTQAPEDSSLQKKPKKKKEPQKKEKKKRKKKKMGSGPVPELTPKMCTREMRFFLKNKKIKSKKSKKKNRRKVLDRHGGKSINKREHPVVEEGC